MKPLLPSKKSNYCTDSVHLIEDGEVVSDPCAVFNEYFTNPVINKSVLSVPEEDFVSHQSVVLIRNKSFDLDFLFDPICDKQITDLLIKLDVKKSCGPDGFSPKLLQIAAPAIAAPLAKLFNCCIESCMWPTQWKISCVTPVYKKEDETNKKNYRPISVLSVIPKLFEKIMFEQLYKTLSPLFSSNMSGFLRGHSCCTVLLKLTDDWRMALDEKKDVGVVAIDLSRVFDSICHNLLLAKLKAYGLQDSAINLIWSYLSDRLQRVKCNGTYSDYLPIRCGVPQMI